MLRFDTSIKKVVAAGVALVMLGAAIGIGAVIEARTHILARTYDRLANRLAPADPLAVRRTQMQTTFLKIEFADFQVTPEPVPIVLAEFGERILFSTHQGVLGWLQPESGQTMGVHTMDSRVPMDWDAIVRTSLWSDPRMVQYWMRTHDIFIDNTGDRVWLYASYHRPARTAQGADCFEFAVSRAELGEARDGALSLSGWQDVFVAQPCVTGKPDGQFFAGLQAGGRMVSRGPGRLLLLVGDHELDGLTGPALSMDPASDFGKAIEIDTVTLEARHVANGMRNPQGLVLTDDGRIWTTEHGPQGGDEVNLFEDGVNYGWPQVTYGLQYGAPAADWPLSERQGRHDGYRLPAFAFVPSIGISNLVAIDASQFPRWEGDLLVTSLYLQTLYRLRIEDNRVIYTETIKPPQAFARNMRDAITLDDGRIAIGTDDGRILFVSNADQPFPIATIRRGDDQGFAIAALTGGAGAAASGPQAAAERGSALFDQHCASCHARSSEVGVGPGLAGIVGRDIASMPGYAYSPVLATAEGDWTSDRLLDYLGNPDERWKGTKMPRIALAQDDHALLVDYLATLPAPR